MDWKIKCPFTLVGQPWYHMHAMNDKMSYVKSI